MIIQIYEVRNLKEAKALSKIGVDHIGILVGFGAFPREIDPKKAQEIIQKLPKTSKIVVLSLSPDLAEIYKIIRICKPEILHIGTLPKNIKPKDILKLKKDFPKMKIMRAIPMTGPEAFKIAKSYAGIADFLLLDSHNLDEKQIGATGKIHDWNISKKIVNEVEIPVILAGGLGPENVAEAIKKVHPFGVDSKTKTDLSNGGGKDLNKVKEFVKIAKKF